MLIKSTRLPMGFNLSNTLGGNQDAIFDIAWSPNGKKIASASRDGTLQIWDIDSKKNLGIFHTPHSVFRSTWAPDGSMVACFESHGWVRMCDVMPPGLRWTSFLSSAVNDLDWSPGGDLIAAACDDAFVHLLDPKTGGTSEQLLRHSDAVLAVAWSPNGEFIASSSLDKTILLWDAKREWVYRQLEGHSDACVAIAWSPVEDLLASGSADRTVGIWDTKTGRQLAILEGHTQQVHHVSFSFDGRFLASSSNNEVRLWRTDDYQMIAALPKRLASFSSNGFTLATVETSKSTIEIWRLDPDAMVTREPLPSYECYSNAKVVLVGDSGVGKSGLALVLTDKPWTETGSTHGRRVWVLDNHEVETDNDIKETRETLLWDLAGQPDYRLIHQLHLIEVAIALVVFDSRSQTDPFAGVRHWDRAIRQAQRVQPEAIPPTQKFLVAARSDVGRIGASADRIEKLCYDLMFDQYFETSAKEGWGIKELLEAIRNAIDWKSLPTVRSTELFQNIKSFLVKEKETGRLLSSTDDLYRAYLNTNDRSSGIDDLRAQFDTCIGRVESRGLIQRLSFGNLILLQPELQDVYASAIANAVKDEPDGLGCIREDKARAGEFRMPEGERIKDAEQEKLLLISTVEDLLRHEIALREQGENGHYLVFPSQLTRENPDLPDPEGKAVIFSFEGPVRNIYATLAVRLTYSGFFKKKEMWKNAATYSTSTADTCGMFIREIDEGRGELTLFFDKASSEQSRFQFEEYIRVHLDRKSLPATVHRRRIFICDKCCTPISDLAAKRRKERGFNWIVCNVCEPPLRVSLLDRDERVKAERVSTIFEIDRAVDTRRELETAASVLQGKIETDDFDVFLCHNNNDKPAVKKVGESLKEKGLLPWLDEWELRPGLPWQQSLEKQIAQIKSAAVFVGAEGLGPWQQRELDAYLHEFVNRGCPIIPVLLEDAPEKPTLPVFLRSMTWVDFRDPTLDPLKRLIWGITGEREFGREYERLSLVK